MARRIATPSLIILAVIFVLSSLVTCVLIATLDPSEWLPVGGDPDPDTGKDQAAVQAIGGLAIEPTQMPKLTPTPDAPHSLPEIRTQSEEYVVQAGDYLQSIAQRYLVSVAAIIEANDLSSPDLLEPGQTLVIPPAQPDENGPAFKVIPDAELIYSPSSVDFDLARFVQQQAGYLAKYREEVDERNLSGVKIVERVAQEYSINPRLLLAVLEYQSGWVTHVQPEDASLEFPMGIAEPLRAGLYRQLAWAANQLNRGYYLWQVNGVPVWDLADGSVISIDPTINAGTAGVQHYFAQLLGREDWKKAVSETGLFATYNQLFGYPFHSAIEPLIPADLKQPKLQLPFEPDQSWAFTGGPHGGWGNGSAWAALDFAPPGDALGCVQSEAWVVAVADGLIVRTGNGAVVQDLDADGFEQTGWTVLYMHIESRDRVREGTFLEAGERVGHPSCEGGVSTGTHVHLARRYNGEWIPADQTLPFILDGWKSVGTGNEYDGYLKRNGKTIEAWEGSSSANAIER